MKHGATHFEAGGSAELVNAVGLHARPAVKLTQLAKSFLCQVEIALNPTGPWVDAKSPVKVMRVRAPHGAVVHVRTTGPDARDATAAILDLIRKGFGEDDLARQGSHG